MTLVGLVHSIFPSMKSWKPSVHDYVPYGVVHSCDSSMPVRWLLPVSDLIGVACRRLAALSTHDSICSAL